MTAKKTTKTEAVADAAGAADTTTDSKPSDAQADEPKLVKGQIAVSTAKGVDRFFRAGRSPFQTPFAPTNPQDLLRSGMYSSR